MTMVRQYPPQPQPLLSPYNNPPPSPNGTLLRNASGFDQVGLSQQLRPQQYAHPLSRHNSYHSQGSASDRSNDRSKPPEHMLRRKTPNGILSAAYDGTSVEQTDKPHATKHILLPVTADSNVPYNFKPELPIRSPTAKINFNRIHQDQPSEWSPSLYFETGSGRGHEMFNSGPHTLTQIDSMLNQIPPLQPPLQYPLHGYPFGGAPGPLIQDPLNPTVSNDQGPFGPYWHDGTFIPYQPAALRDARFYPHHGHGWPTPQWPAHNAAVPPMNNFQQNQFQFNQPPHSYGNIPRPFDYSMPYPAPRNHSIDYHSQRNAVPVAQRPAPDYGLSSSGQTTPVADQTPATTPLAEFGPHSQNAQTREKVFAWAHTVYIDLLKYLQSTRKSSSNARHPNGHQQHVRPHIYPRPPRQPGANFNNTTTNDTTQSSTQLTVNNQAPAIDTQRPVQTQPPFNSRPHFVHGRSASAVSQWPNVPQHPYQNNGQHGMYPAVPGMEPMRPLRRMSGTTITGVQQSMRLETPPSMTAASALDAINKHCEESKWQWIDGILLGGCLAYALGDYQKAQEWYKHILKLDKDHVEATSNLAATLLALQQKHEAECHWRRAVKLRPSYFEAVEHLIGLLCGDHRGQEAVQIIGEVERSLRFTKKKDLLRTTGTHSERSDSSVSESTSISEVSDKPVFEYDADNDSNDRDLDELPGSDQPGFGSSGFAIPGSENGRMLALIHAKGNMLYALGDNAGAARAFENAVLIGAGLQVQGISGLIKHILSVVGYDASERSPGGRQIPPSTDPILLHPDPALKTAQLCFPPHGDLPGLKYVSSEGMARKAAISTTSNSLLSLAKIFQDGMATNSPKASAYQTTYGVREILALYYLSLSLQPSPSTANNVGILLASVQQAAPSKHIPVSAPMMKPQIPGLVPGSGIALALAYYNYGLLLDSRHAHLYTNLGSLLKDIGQLDVAIQMYEQAVQCDGNFDIALANLANAVKDKGRISDAILYYKRAVKASPEFAEAVCGLANALNSVCGWTGRGGIAAEGGSRDRWHVNEQGMLLDATLRGASSSGWIKRVVDLVEKQLADGEDWGRGMMDERFMKDMLRPLALGESDASSIKEKQQSMVKTLLGWRGQKWEGARIVRLVERAIKRLTWQWYQDRYKKGDGRGRQLVLANYRRPQLPSSLTVPAAPTVLPFHTFTCPMSAKQIRLISQRNGLRISSSTLKAPWLPATVFEPPPPPAPYLRVGYVSSDFNNHPLAHLMQSVFGLHDPQRVKAICYATTASDGSIHRQQIEKEAPVFYDASSWPAERLVNQIIRDRIHILINLNGYTRGARNEVFAARPAPIQMSFMGFAGTLGADWCDYLLADETAVPTDTLRPWRRNIDMEDQLVDENSGGSDENWIYGENIIYCRDTFFCCDHRQSAPDATGRQLTWEEEQQRRWAMRKELFPNLPDDAIILGNFNQLYKIEPTTFRTWLRILQRLPKAILWLLRFPDLGETNLKQTALMWAGPEVASRIMFTDVAQKHQHIARARVCDLFLDTPECNAHTTAADVLWSGTPLLTLPRYKYKMCSRMAASILKGALPSNEEGKKASLDLVATGEEDYEEKAVRLVNDCVYRGYRVTGRLGQLRKLLYEARWTSALFDTKRWVRDLEEAYGIAWKKWEGGTGGDIWLQPQRGW
ncbi:glycosyltransferase family 41 protein [Aaosphaeria arxii CBS 175.79]|uniref:protein O-GlcNAc transferase n=1 Tax=Aaosphaeria arxii CBS 175.79 TaxID=1450172 RepID=A0A6A5XBN1_9PLEO|nr:glycosyltransferase family 41 protein [Aaosphaeria arxii CBS 175.79]KAF2010358.1 glycosyltransferase family 41 protein [Aaosphaeria arxii CBS 175.79]